MSDCGSALRPGDVVRIRTERWRVAGQSVFGASTIVDVSGIDASNRGRPARFVLPFEPIDRLHVAASPRVVRPPAWRRLVRATLADAVAAPAALRTAARGTFTPMPFQLEPALAILGGLGSRVLIADAVGLGKTIEAGLIVAEVLARRSEGHALVVCPAALREQWQHELETRFGLRTLRIDTSTLASGEALAAAGANPWASHPVLIASIDYIKRPEVMRGVEEMVWDALVLDEAHALAGRSDRAAAAAAVASRSRVVVTLTATPHAGDDDQFARLCDIGHLPGDGPLLVFRRTRADAGLTSSRRVHWLHVRPTTAEAAMHATLRAYVHAVATCRRDDSRAARLAMSVLTRRACSSAHALARSIERRLTLLDPDMPAGSQPGLPFDRAIDDDEPMLELATPGLADAREERRHLERVLAAATRAIDRESKLASLRRLLRRAKQPAIVFTEYRDTLAHVSRALTACDCVLLHGGLTASERRQAERAFTAGSAHVLLATDAASEGLNLHHRCRLVINLELPWTPLRLEQRVGRVDRLGQSRRVHAVQLVARGTPEEQVLERLVDREWRAATSLDRIARLDADAIAELVEGGMPPARSDAQPPGSVTPDCREAARLECARICMSRALAAGGGTRESRPVVTVVRRRVTPAAYFAWVVPIVTGDGEWVWDATTGACVMLGRLDLTSPARVRESVGRIEHALHDVVAARGRDVLAAFRASTHADLTRALGREQAISGVLAGHRGALATAFAQRRLFDARDERRRLIRSAALDAAIGRCEARLDELTRLAAADLGAPQLAFALLLD